MVPSALNLIDRSMTHPCSIQLSRLKETIELCSLASSHMIKPVLDFMIESDRCGSVYNTMV